ncbi:hypothetical protein ACEPAI_6913 [Sanghuangporus weigelae]
MNVGTSSDLSRILSKLSHLDISRGLVGKDAVRDARGGDCDVYIGHVPSKYIRRQTTQLRVAKTLAREMAMEYGTLRKYLKVHPNSDIARLSLGIAEALKYMHKRNFVHSDVKAGNVLISPSGEPLICDFGISRILSSSESDFVSTTHDEPKHSKETDVWAFGMTLYEMIAKELPYPRLKRDVQVVLAIMNGELPTLPTFQTSMHPLPSLYSTIYAICGDCWDRRHEKRPAATSNRKLIESSQPDPSFRMFPEASAAQGHPQVFTPAVPQKGPEEGREPHNKTSEQPLVSNGVNSFTTENDQSESGQSRPGNEVEETNAENSIVADRTFGHNNRRASPENLEISAPKRFKHGSDVGHLTEAIKEYRSTLALCSNGHPDRSQSLDSL